MKRLLHLSLIMTLLFLLACGGKSDSGSSNSQKSIASAPKDDFSSPKSLFVDHVSSFSGGVFSISESIKLRLTKNIENTAAIDVSEFFDFSPSIDGIATWEDDRTIVFHPSDWLQPNQKYEVTAHLDQVIPSIAEDKENFKFTFQTLQQNFEVKTGGIKLYNAQDLSKIKVEGTVQTADVTNQENLQKILAATQNGNNLPIEWEPTNAANTYAFTVTNVTRSKQASKVTLIADGQAIKVNKTEEYSVEIPSLDDFKIVSSQVIRGADNHISVLFSDPLNPRQNLTGLITFSNTRYAPRVVIDANELKVYPTHKITNSAELTVHQGLENVGGFKLKEDYVTSLQFSQIKPEVKLLSNDNQSILPSGKGLILPFQAVALNAVDVTVIKIFEENVLQYLQVNHVGGQSQLRRVGKPILKKTIPLNTSGVTDLNTWNRFTLDLEDLFKTEPGAIYQIRIGFSQKNSLYFCQDNDDIQQIDELDNWDNAEEEASYWDDYYYSYDYNWEERDNPCSSSYYGSRRSVKKMLFASDLGIIAKRRDGGELHTFVTNLNNTATLNGVEIMIYDYQQQLIARGKTDSDGKAIIPLDEKPYVIVAKQDDQIGYLRIDDGSSLSLSNFDVSGTRVTNGLKGFIYGERGVWRPADTVHLSFILEDGVKTLPEDHPVVMELYNPSSQLTFRKVSSEGVSGIYRFDFITGTDAPTGNWLATAKVGGASFNKTVKIETIKPNRLKVNLKFDKDKFSSNDQNISADLNVRWLSGATASGLKAEYEMILKPVNTTFENYGNYEFDDESKVFYSSREMVYEGKVDQNGYARLNLELGDNEDAPGALMANFYGKVYEEGGDFSISNTSIPYYPYSSFVGVSTPEGDKRGMLLTDKAHTINIVSLDAEGRPVSRKNVKVDVYKLSWRWWWDQSYNDISNYVGRSYRSPIATDEISTVNGKGTYELQVNYPDWGRYYVRVEDPISGHSAGKVVYLDWPGWAGKGKRGELGGATMLDFAVEKDSYEVGEKIVMSIPSTAGNKVLVSLESGSKILQTFWVTTKDKNTNISIEATPDMAPNVYAHITMIQPHGQTENDLPIRLYGVQSIKVVDPATVLSPKINMPKELRPEQTFDIEISEEKGKAMAYTIAVVDEGLLDITNYKTPDPWPTFYAREALGIKTWDIYDDVLGAFAGKMDHLLAIGGDGEISAKEEKEANRFKPVVKFIGPFYLQKGKKAKHTLTMPQYIGSVKTMVIAASDGAYGSTDETTPVKQPLMILATLPRVAGPGEQMKLPVNVFALEDKIKDVTISIITEGALNAGKTKTKNVRFEKAGDQVIYFDIEAAERLGTGKVKVIAKSGSLEAKYDIDINIIARNPLTVMIEDKVVNAGESWDINYTPLGLLGQNQGIVELSTLPPLNLEKRMKYLIRYPHGCVEQTTSSVFPQLFLEQLTTLSDKQKNDIQRNVEAGIQRLKKFQLGSGGFSYWPGNLYANNWGTNYAGHFLVEAQKLGYAVPESMLSAWVSYQTQKAENWGSLSSDDNNDLIQAYRLYTLAKAGSPALGAMNRMKEKTNISVAAKWRLALAYEAAGYQPQAESIIENLPEETTQSNGYRYSFGSDTRDKAMILETLIGLEKSDLAFSTMMQIAKSMSEDRWMSTQTTAYAFIAIAKYSKVFELSESVDVTVSMKQANKTIQSTDFVNSVAVSDGDKNTKIAVKNNGKASVFARLVKTGIPLVGDETSTTRNLKLNVSYTDLDDQTIDISNLDQGTNFKAVVTITNPGISGNYSELALTQLFPSGWEIINTRLDGSESENTADYTDIRDDRVMHYFDLGANKSVTFTVLLNAAYQGKYYLPAVKAEAMYDNNIYASKEGKWVTVSGK